MPKSSNAPVEAVVLVRQQADAARSPAIESVRRHTPAEVPVRAIPRDEIAAAAAAARPADVVVVDQEVTVRHGWFQGLRGAVGSDTTIATAGAMVLEEGAAKDDAAPLPTARSVEGVRLCCWIRRPALDLAGPLDDGFWARCTERGAIHVEVGSVIVTVPAAEPGVEEPADVTGWHPRPPNLRERNRVLARRASGDLQITIDGRVLTGVTNGTQVHVLALAKAMVEAASSRVRVLMPIDPAPEAVAELESVGAATLSPTDVVDAARTPVVHRPHQISSHEDLLILRHAGERLVVTHQDLLLFHNPAYHRDREAWSGYRRLTATSLAVADLVTVCSDHTARDLAAEELVDPARIVTVPLGTDHAFEDAPGSEIAPPLLGALGGRPFLLCVGSDLRHKNRPFALDLLAALRRRGWDGGLALAGPHVEHGSSAAEERQRLAADPALAAVVADLGTVDEQQRSWLYRHAAAVMYPTTYEGFGLVPFEAAAAGTACLFAPQTSLGELLPGEGLLVAWDAEASAERAFELLTDHEAARAQVGRIRTRARHLTWRATAERLLTAYDAVLETMPPAASWALWAALEAESGRASWESRYWLLRQEIGPTGMALVTGEQPLPDDVQRTLAALNARASTRRLLTAAARAARAARLRH